MSELLDPAEVAADMLRKQLPGFDTRIIASRDAISIRGALPIYAGISQETVRYPVLYAERGGFGEPHLGSLTQIDLEELVMPIVSEIVDQVQKLAIEAVNLRPRIDRLVKESEQQGRQQGYQEGLKKGHQEGRRELLQELEYASQVLVRMLEVEE